MTIARPESEATVEHIDGYTIELLGPNRWRVSRNGREIEEVRTASKARIVAKRAAFEHRLLRRALRHVLVILLAGLALAAIQPFKDVANPAAERAAVFTDTLDEAYAAIRAGDASPADFTAAVDGFTGGVIDGGVDIGNVDVAPTTRERYVLAGSFEGECYVVRWPPDGRATTGVLAEDLPCAPGVALGRIESYVRSSQSTDTTQPLWEGTAPPATTRVRWYLPATIGLVALMVDGAIGASVALIRRSRGA